MLTYEWLDITDSGSVSAYRYMERFRAHCRVMCYEIVCVCGSRFLILAVLNQRIKIIKLRSYLKDLEDMHIFWKPFVMKTANQSVSNWWNKKVLGL
jgi:hypothetical protein